MELIEMLRKVPPILLIFALLIFVAITVYIILQHLAKEGLKGIRVAVYGLYLKAEHMYKDSAQGKLKMKWVIQQARGLLPEWITHFISEDVLTELVQRWFDEVKDLLDDGKLNKSTR